MEPSGKTPKGLHASAEPEQKNVVMPDIASALLRAEAVSSSALASVDLTVATGECLAVVGPSGVGKSTLLRALADLVPHTGKVWLEGREQSDYTAPDWRKRVVYVSSEAGWWADRIIDHFPVEETALHGHMDRLGLSRTLCRSVPERLSTGERQRFSLLRALYGSPRVLLLDEPTSALDEASTRVVEELLSEWVRQENALIMASHDVQQVRRLAGNALPGHVLTLEKPA